MTTTAVHLTTRLDCTDFQARAADDIRDLLESVAVLWSDRKDSDRRKLIVHLTDRIGLPTVDAELAAEQYHRSVRLLIDALATAAHAAKTVDDSHATMMGAANRHLMATNRPPITGVSL